MKNGFCNLLDVPGLYFMLWACDSNGVCGYSGREFRRTGRTGWHTILNRRSFY